MIAIWSCAPVSSEQMVLTAVTFLSAYGNGPCTSAAQILTQGQCAFRRHPSRADLTYGISHTCTVLFFEVRTTEHEGRASPTRTPAADMNQAQK